MSTTRSTRTPYATHLVVAHNGFKCPANNLAEAEAIKARYDARYPGETSTIRQVRA